MVAKAFITSQVSGYKAEEKDQSVSHLEKRSVTTHYTTDVHGFVKMTLATPRDLCAANISYLFTLALSFNHLGSSTIRRWILASVSLVSSF